MMFSQRVREKIDAIDQIMINRMRIAAVLIAALVFGVALRGHMFSQETLAVSSVSLQPALVYQLADARDSEEKVVVVEEVTQQEGDVALLAEEPADVVIARNDPAPAVIEEFIPDTMPVVAPPPVATELSANAFIVARGASGRDAVYEKNTRIQLSPASLTKLMTAVIVTEYIDNNDSVIITARAVNAEGVAGSLRADETFSVADLLKVMLVVSSNDAATAFEDHFASQGLDLVSLMNEKAKLLGMVDTHFVNPTGLDDSDHYASAADLAVLAAYSLRHEEIWDILSKTSENVRSLNKKISHTLVSNNELLHKKRPDVLGGKTGYTKNAGGCMITVLTSGEVIVVLGSDERAEDTQRLIQLITNN